MRATINQINAQAGKKITPLQASSLIAKIQTLQSALGFTPSS